MATSIVNCVALNLFCFGALMSCIESFPAQYNIMWGQYADGASELPFPLFISMFIATFQPYGKWTCIECELNLYLDTSYSILLRISYDGGIFLPFMDSAASSSSLVLPFSSTGEQGKVPAPVVFIIIGSREQSDRFSCGFRGGIPFLLAYNLWI